MSAEANQKDDLVMAKKKKKNKQNKARINENKFILIMPGMLMSTKTLIQKSGSEFKNRDAKAPGTWIAAVIISAQCAELLLKYKVEQEGHILNRSTHDLYHLYRILNTKSKTAIEEEFKGQSSMPSPLDGWESAESVFLKARTACTNWRFAVQHNDISLTDLHSLYRAAVSVYKTIPILQLGLILESKLNVTEVTDPETRDRVFNFIKS